MARLLCWELTLQNEYLRLENRLLRDKMPGRLRFTDEERRSLSETALAMGRSLMKDVVSIVKPETILAWQRRLERRKWDYSLRHEAARWIVMRSRTRHDRVSHHPYPTRKIESPRTTYPIPIAGSIRTVRGRCGCQHQAAWGQGGRHGQHM